MKKEIDYFGDDVDCIHLKFGEMRKHYNFTEAFRKKHPTFCAEFDKYWDYEPSMFESPLQVVNYVEHWGIKMNFYFNYTKTLAKNNAEVQQYLVRENMPRNYGKFVDNNHVGWDGEKERGV